MRILTLCLLLLLSISCALANIINIPADAGSIQAGISLAVDGDTVLVADSMYYENINFNGKAITVASHFILDQDTSHISKTIIDGSQPGNPDSASVVLFTSGEDSNSVFCGFTLRGGTGTLTSFGWPGAYGYLGGGIYCLNSSPKIANSIITENNGGGYINGEHAKPHFLNVSITRNNPSLSIHYSEHSGGGLYCIDCAPKLENIDISYNIANNDGGGIYCKQSSPFFSNVSIHHNIASDDYGGGIFFYESTPSFDPVNRCNIYLNLARDGGNDVAAEYESTTNYQVVLDTFTVFQTSEIYAYPLSRFSIDIQNEKIIPVASDLYINPVIGDDNNSGLTQAEPLKSITMGLFKATATENDPRTLYLANGRYTPSTEFHFPIFLQSHFALIGESRNGVVFDAEGEISIFDLTDGRENVSLNNLTLTGCSGGEASIYCYRSELNMMNMTIQNNQGIGAWIRNNSNAHLDNCLFANNGEDALNIAFGSEAIVTNTIIEKNDGTGLKIGGSVNLDNVIIQDNNSIAIDCGWISSLNANNVSILRNQEFDYFCDGTVNIRGASSASFTNSIISENKIDGRGGGMYIEGSTVDLSSVEISSNEASISGGGIFIDNQSNVGLSDVSLRYNKAGVRGGGICFLSTADIRFDSVSRCNIYQNDGPNGSDLWAELYTGIISVKVDTFSVLEPTSSYAYPLENFSFDILNVFNVTKVEESLANSNEFILSQNYPNPFNPKTTINYELPITNYVELSIYSVLGQKVATLITAKQKAGFYTTEWDASGFSSGVYFYRLSAGGNTQNYIETKKLILLK